MNSTKFCTLKLSVLLCIFIGSAALAQNKGRLDFSAPKTPPKFREVYPDAEYAKLLVEAQAKVDVKPMEQRRLPAGGLFIHAVAPGSAAQEAGLKAGDVITRINGSWLWAPVYNWPWAGDTLQQVHVIRDMKPLSIKMRPDITGIQYQPYWEPARLYLNRAGRNPKWDPHVIVAISVLSSDPKLAEAAWARAIKAGYPSDVFSAMCGLELAMSQGRWPEALEFAWAASKANRDRGELVHPHVLYRTAIANGLHDAVAAIVARDPAAFPNLDLTVVRKTAEDAADPLFAAPRETPFELAAKMRRQSLFPVLETHDDEGPPKFKQRLIDNQAITYKALTDHVTYLRFPVGMLVGDVELLMRIRAKPTEEKRGRASKGISLSLGGLFNDGNSPDWRKSSTILGVMVEDFGDVSLFHGLTRYRASYRDVPRLDGKQDVFIHLIRVGQQGEIRINDTRVALVPASNEFARCQMLFKAWGVGGQVTETQFNALMKGQ